MRDIIPHPAEGLKKTRLQPTQIPPNSVGYRPIPARQVNRIKPAFDSHHPTENIIRLHRGISKTQPVSFHAPAITVNGNQPMGNERLSLHDDNQIASPQRGRRHTLDDDGIPYPEERHHALADHSQTQRNYCSAESRTLRKKLTHRLAQACRISQRLSHHKWNEYPMPGSQIQRRVAENGVSLDQIGIGVRFEESNLPRQSQWPQAGHSILQ